MGYPCRNMACGNTLDGTFWMAQLRDKIVAMPYDAMYLLDHLAETLIHLNELHKIATGHAHNIQKRKPKSLKQLHDRRVPNTANR